MVRIFFLVFFVTAVACKTLFVTEPENKRSNQWALLVAGSSGWSNYRHQEIRFLETRDDEADLEMTRALLQLRYDLERIPRTNEEAPVVNGCTKGPNVKQDSIDAKEKDEFDIYGEHVAISLRNLQKKNQRSMAKFRINNILYEMEFEQYNEKPQERTPLRSVPYEETTDLVDEAKDSSSSEDYRYV